VTIQAGEKMPSGAFGVTTDSGAGAISTDELFSGKKVVFVALPGAFTATCSSKHLPGLVAHADDFASKGVDTVACMSVNDTAVMDAWGKDQGVGGSVLLLADGNGDYAKALGLDVDLSAFGMGTRATRFAIIVEDGTAKHVAVEEPGKFEVSSAEGILAQL